MYVFTLQNMSFLESKRISWLSYATCYIYIFVYLKLHGLRCVCCKISYGIIPESGNMQVVEEKITLKYKACWSL